MLKAAVLALATALSVSVPALDGQLVDPLQPAAGVRATVLLFVSTECPVSNRYAPDLRAMHDAFANNGVAFWLVYPDPEDSATKIREQVASFRFPGMPLRDAGHRLANAAGATITPEAAVYDARGILMYRGRIDDRYSAIGVERPAATRHDLRDAITATLAGTPIAQRFTQAVGCYIADATS